MFTLIFIPGMASLLDRERLPAHNSDYIGPANYMTVVLNRNYVHKDLKKAVIAAAAQFGDKHPEAKIAYLDAGFPLFSWIPMLPHKSHNTGKSLDIAFVYNDSEGEIKRGSPSWTGYGVFASDKLSKQQKKCLSENGLYDMTKYLGLSVGKGEYELNTKLTQDLIRIFHKQRKIKKIFLEPTLKRSLGLGRFKKIRFHGCESVRHDDHFHIEIE